LGEHDHAATAYTDLVMDEVRNVDRTELSHAYKYLTQYHLKREQLDPANHYAQKCLQFDETKEEAKVLLRTIAEKRAKVEETSMVVSNKSIMFYSQQLLMDYISCRWTI
jgi:anaphase-promoting complex subunit 8